MYPVFRAFRREPQPRSICRSATSDCSTRRAEVGRIKAGEYLISAHQAAEINGNLADLCSGHLERGQTPLLVGGQRYR